MNKVRAVLASPGNWLRQRFELFFWIATLILLFFLSEERSDTSLCVFTWMGWGHCPGCGIRHAIHYALHGRFITSFKHHPMGIFAVMVIFIRIKQLAYPANKPHETQPH